MSTVRNSEILDLFNQFSAQYDAKSKDLIWQDQSRKFRSFWKGLVLTSAIEIIEEATIDEIVRILDRNAKGNKKDSEAVAKAMVAQGAWRRMFAKLHGNQEMAKLVWSILEEEDVQKKISGINKLYDLNEEGAINNLTGPSGNTINAMLCAYDPFQNASMISLNDRRTLIEHFGFSTDFDFDKSSIGEKIVKSNSAILSGFKGMGIEGSARTVSRFCYYAPMKDIWRVQHVIKGPKADVPVSVPTDSEKDELEIEDQDEIRESLQIQALLSDAGSKMGMKIWLPKSDRTRVLKAWKAPPDALLDKLPLNYDNTTLKTIEQIDVLWLKKRSIVRAFEVEHTTSIYSGILRMADLVALQPNMNIKLHIVAPSSKRDKVLQEIRRPIFSILENGPLAKICTYISYDALRDLVKEKHLDHMSDTVLDELEEVVETD